MSPERITGGDGCGGNAAPYVLGALTEEESRAFVEHLAGCAVCREEVAALRTVAAALPAAAPQFHAPPELKRRLFQAVDAEARVPARAAGRAGRRERDGGLRGGLPAWRGRLVPAGVTAALAAAVAAVLIAALGGSGSSTRLVRAAVSAPGASATVAVNGARGELRVANMPQVQTGRVYEVWTVRGKGAPQPTDALFTVSRGGSASVAIPGGVRGVSEVLVSSEPLGGSRAPTRSPVVVARLS